MKLDTFSSLYTKINPIWIIDRNVRVKTKKVLAENVEVNLHELRLGKAFLVHDIKSTSNENNNR